MNPIAQYPVFEENQVLTAKNLNDVVEFLNKQDLATRRNLLGIGIVCGIKLSSNLSDTVSISKGCGVTSLGHLITIPDMDLLHYRVYQDPVEPPYGKFRKTQDVQYPLWELFTDEEYILAKEPDNIKKLGSTGAPDLKDKAVLLYLEIFDKDPDRCIAEDCDQMATSRLFNLRKLLINKDDLLEIINKTCHGNNVKDYMTALDLFGRVNSQCKLPAVAIHRLNKNLSDLTNLNLAQINSWDKLKDAYKGVLKADVLKISKALFISYEAYKAELDGQYPAGHPFPGFDNPELDSNPLFELLTTEIEKETDGLNIQYAYDFLHDLSKAYTEFSDVANEYNAKCCPDPDQFPLHLMLGLLNADNPKENMAFRHKWQPSPAVSDMKDVLDELRMLHYKMYVMVKHFQLRNFSSLNDIRITPGKFTGFPFSRHTAAHYYMSDEDPSKLVSSFWNYHLTKQCKEDTVLSYFPKLYSTKDFVKYPLMYSLRDYDYFRIEGHIGQEYKSVFNTLEKKLKEYNLPFDLLGVKLAGDHLDVEIGDHCFEDIQTSYKVNRDEHLACLLAIYDPIKALIDKVLAMDESERLELLQKPLPEGMVFGFLNTFGDIFLFLQLYAFLLKQAIDQLPESVRDFNFPVFQIANYKVTSFSFLLSIVLEFLSNKSEQFPLFVSLILPRTLLDRLIDDCIEAKFKSLYELYRERLLKTQMGRLFPGYVSGSPGMEHIAGVKEGGTFILVYDEMPEGLFFFHPLPFPGIIPIPLDPCFEDERAQFMQLKVLQFTYVMYKKPDFFQEYQYIIDPDEEKMKRNAEDGRDDGGNIGVRGNSIHFQATHFQNRINKLPPRYHTIEGFLATLFPGLGKDEETEQKIYRVVADFAIPYRCCKECLKVDKIEEPPPELSIELDKDNFCRKDDSYYVVSVKPAVKEGILTSTAGGIEQGDDGSWHFRPCNTDWTQEEVTLTYTVGEDNTEKVITVYNPIAKIVVTHFVSKLMIVLENHSENAEKYIWIIPELEINETRNDKSDFIIMLNEINVDKITPTLIAIRQFCEDEHTPEPIIIEQGLNAVILNLRERGYEADAKTAAFHHNLMENITTNNTIKKAFSAGKMNTEIGTQYRDAMGDTITEITAAHKRGDKKTVDYLVKAYVGMLEQVAITTEALGASVDKRSGIYKRMAEAKEQLGSLKKLKIDINTGKKLKALIDKTSGLSMRDEMKQPIMNLLTLLK